MSISASTKMIKDDQLELLVIENSQATAVISLFGGHVVSYIPKSDNRERLWLSPLTFKDAHKPIRGGVPVCWPWFSDSHGQPKGVLPSHGFVRTQSWHIEDKIECDTETVVTLAPLSAQGDGFDGQASLLLVVSVGKTLKLELITENIGATEFSYTCALHTYFAIEDISQVRLEGITGEYEDKTQRFSVFPTPEHYVFTQETDRVHNCTSDKVTIHDGKVNTEVGSKGHDSLVVWNPWSDNAKAMADMPDNGYMKMVCVETAITGGKRLRPGESHCLTQVVD